MANVTKPMALDETLQRVAEALETPSEAVLFTEQELTEAQKAQARANIGVLPANATPMTVTLALADWIEGDYSYTQTIQVAEILSTDYIIVTPAPASYLNYGEAECRCISQADGSLTFEAESLPISVLSVNLLVWR